MDYNFTYKSPQERRTLSRRFLALASEFLYKLYSNKYFKKLKLDRNHILYSYTQSREHRAFKNNLFKPLTEFDFKAYSISYLDCVKMEDAVQTRNALIKHSQRYGKGGWSSDNPIQRLNETFIELKERYKIVSFGNLYYCNLREDDEFDLINSVQIKFIKGPESHFIIYYVVYPSEKFQNLLWQSFGTEPPTESYIKFNSVRNWMKGKKLFLTHGTSFEPDSYWTKKVFNELNFQFKHKFLKEMDTGAFMTSRSSLFPQIISFKHNGEEFETNKNDVLSKLGINSFDLYQNEGVYATLESVDLHKNSCGTMQLFFESGDKKMFLRSEDYLIGIVPLWTLLNVSALNTYNIVDFQNRIFNYLKNSKDTIFLKRVINLRTKITASSIAYKRLKKDFTNKLLTRPGFVENLNAKNDSHHETRMFRKELISRAKYVASDISESYKDLLELVRTINESKSIKANMMLQRILLFLAIIGVLLAIYGSNSKWCNNWVSHLLKKHFDVEIPTVPSDSKSTKK